MSSVAAKNAAEAWPLGKLDVRRLADGVARVAGRRRATAVEQPLEALVDDEALDAEQGGEQQRGVGLARRWRCRGPR